MYYCLVCHHAAIFWTCVELLCIGAAHYNALHEGGSNGFGAVYVAWSAELSQHCHATCSVIRDSLGHLEPKHACWQHPKFEIGLSVIGRCQLDHGKPII